LNVVEFISITNIIYYKQIFKSFVYI